MLLTRYSILDSVPNHVRSNLRILNATLQPMARVSIMRSCAISLWNSQSCTQELQIEWTSLSPTRRRTRTAPMPHTPQLFDICVATETVVPHGSPSLQVSPPMQQPPARGRQLPLRRDNRLTRSIGSVDRRPTETVGPCCVLT
jgi:hypothetical protein